MRSRIARAHIHFAITAVIIACSSAPDQISRPGPRATSPLLDAAEDANPVVASVTGHWEVTGMAGNLNKLSVNALQRLDQSVGGEVQFERDSLHVLTAVAHGTVICLTIVGDTARIGAVGKLQGNDGSPAFAVLTAIDHGEGANMAPDSASALLITSSANRAKLHCSNGLIAPFRIFPVERGNIQVRSIP